MKNKKAILALVLLLVIGFASVSTTLVLNGVIGISNKKDDFKVIFTNAKLDNVERQEFIDSETKQTLTYETNKLTTLNETTVLEYEVANTSRLYDASVSITYNLVDDADNAITSEYVSMEYTPNNMIVEAGKTKTGSITTKLTKVSTEDSSIKVKCELNANATERDSLGEEYVAPVLFPEGYELTDTNRNGIADIGEEIKVGTESFYVISNNGTKLNALAKYNLNVGSNKNPDVTEGIQHETVRGNTTKPKYGNVAFSNSKGWAYSYNNTIDIKAYAGPVKDALYGENGYEKYVQKTIPNSSVRLITNSELISLGCSYSSWSCAEAPSWIYNTSYWTQSAYSDNGDCVWRVSGVFNVDGYFNTVAYGVRPVITIPLS